MPRIGPYSLHTIDAGRFALDGGAMFGIIPKPLWSRRIRPDERNRIPLQMRCLLLEGNGRVILIDTGAGDKFDEKFADIYGMDNGGRMEASLQSAGFMRGDVTDVILTHLHFDHCGGSTLRDGHRLLPAFPKAVYHVQQRHWDWALEPNARERGSFLRENFVPVEAAGQLSLVEGDVTLFEGVSVFTVDGHTESQQLVRIEDANRTLIFAADLLPTSHHIAPVWGMAYDVRPLAALEEKNRFTKKAIEEGWTIFFEHDPDVEIGELEQGERGPVVGATRLLTEF